MRIVFERLEQQFERLGWLRAVDEVAGQRRTCAPLSRRRSRELPAKIRESVVVAGRAVRPLEAFQRQVRAILRYENAALPGRDRASDIALLKLRIAEVKVGRNDSRVEIDGGFEPPDGVLDAAFLQGLQAQ